jgi:AcrR family transcriptional regulator
MAGRRDVRGNRERILAAAEEVFGSRGASASTEEVASRAGVGVATVFRHFPTKAGLIEAVTVAHFDRLRREAESLLTDPDPGRAFFDLFTAVVADAATKLSILDALADAGGDADGPAGTASLGLRRAVGRLLDRAQRAAAVRADVELPELYLLLVGMSRAAARTDVDDEVRTRALAIVFDGLTRPQGGV